MLWTVVFVSLALVLMLVIIPLVNQWRAKRLIVAWLHDHQCEVRTIKRAQVGRVEWDSRMPCYFVEYSNRDNRPVRKLCMVSGMGIGVIKSLFWRDPTPDDLLPGDWQCFECRARIPAGGTKCPRCGWS